MAGAIRMDKGCFCISANTERVFEAVRYNHTASNDANMIKIRTNSCIIRLFHGDKIYSPEIILSNNKMDNYIKNFDLFKNSIVYNFNLGNGGIGDCIKFFMIALESCIKSNTRLYYKINNIEIEKYIKLKYDKMYINENTIKQLEYVEQVSPIMYYSNCYYDYSIDIKDVFYFTDDVIINCNKLFPSEITSYISIHLRLGDKYLELEDKRNVQCVNDARQYSEEKIYKFIEENCNKNIFFCCDNNTYKLKIKEKYNNIIITKCDIGHTCFSTTSKQQVLDAITEFYILTNSELIYGASNSGFSIVASKFNNIPLIT